MILLKALGGALVLLHPLLRGGMESSIASNDLTAKE